VTAPQQPAQGPAQDPSASDLGLRLPLHGARLIEASAGTGKTFTLATLVLRLLLERGAALSRMSIVTFTRAATQELRQRLRRRLRLARRLLDAPDAAGPGEAAITAAVLRAAIARDGAALVRQRLEAALLQLDEAAIATIHGFCHRALREFGFRAGLLGDTRVIDDVGEVWNEVASELWRAASNVADADAGDAALFGDVVATDVHALLAALWKTPEALAEDLPALCDPLRIVHPHADASAAAAALHALRDAASRRFEATMTRRGESSQDQLIERLWRATGNDDFAAALGARWPLLLIDEFQDTDPRQWDIFERMHLATDPQQRWLCLIGDPKQAIYRFRGGDLETYLRARDRIARQAGADDEGIAALDANYRSSPALLRAIETLFAASPLPFVDARIGFQSVRAAGGVNDGDLRVGDAPAPALTLHWLPPGEGRGGMRVRDDEFAMMTDAAVRAIAQLLRAGRLREGDGERPLRPADIAVLTQTNDQAATMRAALARAGIAAATIATASVFAGEAADELRALLTALAEPADEGRFRAALATRLLGRDAAAIVALDADPERAQREAERFAAAAELWRARGPLPALLPFLRDAAPRWLAEDGGARRLTDALHLAELLQAESASRHGPAEQLRWFAQQCAADVSADETRQLRLEADAGLVQIATIHKSKGLEYPVVVLPFVAWRSEGGNRGLSRDDACDPEGRPARVWRCKGVLDVDDIDWIDAAVDREERAEAQRQLYVALTRAQHALHVVWSRNARTETTALHWLLHAGAPTGRKADRLDHAGMRARIDALAAASGGSIAVVPFDPDAPAAPAQRAAIEDAIAVPPARRPRRRFADLPRLHSFSSLHARSAAGEDAFDDSAARGADDETVAVADTVAEADDLGGTAFGNAVHDVLEAAEAALWRRMADIGEDRWPAAQRALLERALLRHGLAPTPAHLAQTARLVSRALNVALPGGVRLHALPATRQVRELGFHFRLRSVRTDALDALLEAHGHPRTRRTPPRLLEGLMHGYIDLVYRDDAGRHHVLDYKTNRLPAYDPTALRRAVRTRDYDLQYLIYLVALRRWLRLRRGARYDDARDLGGAVYLFLRGIDPRASDEDDSDAGEDFTAAEIARSGVHVDPVSPALLAALDALFDGEVAGGGGRR
jgi:exodeoxyribonuclease V beta subunit